jgi:glycosyltransferase involved in cell wall biosynthesis
LKSIAQPLFSVLIANYNNGRYLETCIQSIFSQTYSHWEVVIVDDGSTDDSDNVYKKYRHHSQLRIFKNHENKGCGYTKRKCVEYAKGEICGFVDADDALSPDALEMMVKGHLDNPEASIVYSTHYICDENLQLQEIADYVGQIPAGRRSMTLFSPTISAFATFKMEKYAMTEGISEIYPKAVDKDLYFKLEETGPVVFIDQPLYLYRHHSGSISLNRQKRIAHHYELTVKFLALFRQSQAWMLLAEIPHSKRHLIGGVAKVLYYEVKKGQFLFAGRLCYKLLISFPVTLVKLIFKKVIPPWRIHNV